MNAPAQYVFGYGSLAAEHARGHVASLRGRRRGWGVAMDNSRDLPGYKFYRLRADGSRPAIAVAFLDIEPDPASAVTGICMPAGERDLAALDRRERNYERVDVSGALEGGPPGQVWTYPGSQAGRARLREGVAAGRAAVSRDYLAAVLAGLASVAPDELDGIERSLRSAGLAVLDLDRVDIR